MSEYWTRNQNSRAAELCRQHGKENLLQLLTRLEHIFETRWCQGAFFRVRIEGDLWPVDGYGDLSESDHDTCMCCLRGGCRLVGAGDDNALTNDLEVLLCSCMHGMDNIVEGTTLEEFNDQFAATSADVIELVHLARQLITNYQETPA